MVEQSIPKLEYSGSPPKSTKSSKMFSVVKASFISFLSNTITVNQQEPLHSIPAVHTEYLHIHIEFPAVYVAYFQMP